MQKEDKKAEDINAGRRRGIQSVEIGMHVLQALASLGSASTLGAIAQASDISPSQAHRYLASLIASGMAQQNEQTGRYDLGPAALQLGLGALARIDAFRITNEAISAFAERTGQTVQVAALGPLGPTIIRWLMGRPPVMTSFNVGSVLPMLTSATGHIFLSFSPPAYIDHLVAAELGATTLTKDDVDAIRGRVTAEGRARVEGTMIPGLRAIAFPIFDLQNRAILSATALFPGTSPAARNEAMAEELGQLCHDLSLQLGWQPD
ncbi:IclR family transcriptional regulator [Sphingobium sp.]|uniref:IclR family transcriptional regulator n=1 Tax=Sphingobium sp. TaxID=1912891 RepID=UPI0026026829|nr:IclR family transcriptional regulator [Sphingobium sp.]